jgi:predicted ArsR family transcriptional regulator
MLLTVFQDLLKPQWRVVLEHLKVSGGLPVSELAKQVDASYMAVKQHCEELMQLGYLERSRVPRTAVGRPEIFYRLSGKADALFPDAGVAFTLKLLEELKSLFGEVAADKLLFQYFEKEGERWESHLTKFELPWQKACKLMELREKSGVYGRCEVAADESWRMVEYHHPLQRIFEVYPRALVMEQRQLEKVLGCRLLRQEVRGGGPAVARVVFEPARF